MGSGWKLETGEGTETTRLEHEHGAHEDDDDGVARGEDAERLDLVVARVHVRDGVHDGAAGRDAHGDVDGHGKDVRRWEAGTTGTAAAGGRAGDRRFGTRSGGACGARASRG